MYIGESHRCTCGVLYWIYFFLPKINFETKSYKCILFCKSTRLFHAINRPAISLKKNLPLKITKHFVSNICGWWELLTFSWPGFINRQLKIFI